MILGKAHKYFNYSYTLSSIVLRVELIACPVFSRHVFSVNPIYAVEREREI